MSPRKNWIKTKEKPEWVDVWDRESKDEARYGGNKKYKGSQEGKSRREVVRVSCMTAATSLRGGSGYKNLYRMGGYPTQKKTLMIKCTKKGLNGAQKPRPKPHSRKWKGNKVLHWYERNGA